MRLRKSCLAREWAKWLSLTSPRVLSSVAVIHKHKMTDFFLEEEIFIYFFAPFFPDCRRTEQPEERTSDSHVAASYGGVEM